MKLMKIALRFFAIFSIVYAVLIIPQMNIGEVYSRFIRTQGEMLFGDFGNKGRVEFEANPKEENKWEYRNRMLLTNRQKYEHAQKSGAGYQMAKVYLSWYFDYLPSALLFSLIIATPIAFRRKILALIVGLTLLHLYIAFMLLVTLLFKFHSYPTLDVVSLNSFWNSIVEFIYPVVAVNPGTSVFVVITIWIMVCFRTQDLSQLVNRVKIKTIGE